MGPTRHPAIALVATLMISAAEAGEPDYAGERRQMVAEVAAMARATAAETGRQRFADPVLRAMDRVPRHRFVPEAVVGYAYRNQPLSIGDGQTISQPYIVALSTELLDPKASDVVLEVGTGSGYQAAVLAELVDRVYSIEIIEPLGRQAADRLAALGYRNVEVRIGDGYQGWAENAPFDAIVVTAAAPHVPEPLLAQLKPGGKMVIPVVGRARGQEMLLVVKGEDGTLQTRAVIPVRFVPLTGDGTGIKPHGR